MVNSELATFLQSVKAAKGCEDVFGDLTKAIVKYDAARQVYLKFSKLVHVDRWMGQTENEAAATEAFSLLSMYWREAEDKIKKGTYGKVTPRTGPTVVASKTGKYTILSTFAIGDLSNIYRAEKEDGQQVLVKISRHPAIEDLMVNEARVLAALRQNAADGSSWGDYFPSFVDAFRVKDDKGQRRYVVVTKWRDGFFPLVDVMAQYPRGVDPRHFVWIFKRLLSVLIFTARNKVVHGAIIPTHVLVRPANHGLMLVDWSYAVPDGAKVQALSPGWRSIYAPEVLAKQTAALNTDIFMAAKCMDYIMGGEGSYIPTAFRRFLDGCLLQNPSRRPPDAEGLYDAFSALVTEVYGPPKWVDLVLTA